MRRIWEWITTGLLVLLPAATLLVGVGLQVAAGDGTAPGGQMARIAIASALTAPFMAIVLLWHLADGFDLVLVAAAAMVTSVGTVALIGLAEVPGPGQPFYREIVARHGMFIGVGFAALVAGALAARRIETATRLPYTMLVGAFLLTGVTIVMGDAVNGARLWLDIGPLRFQPSEVARLLLVVFMAIYLHERRHLLAASWRVRSLDLPPAPYLIPVAGAVLGAAAVLVFQNDLGMAALLVLGAFATVAGVIRSRGSVALAVVLLGVAALGAYAGVPRVRARVAGWLGPWENPLGTGFQFVQADYSLASSGMLGVGNGSSAVRVPEVHTDFILIGLGSQFGLMGTLAILGLTAIVILRCAINATRAPHGFGALLSVSLAALLGIQVILIVGGTLRVLPLTGLTFPLLSYGGTSMVMTLFAIGIIVGLGSEGRDRGRQPLPAHGVC